MIEFLCKSPIHYAITASPPMYRDVLRTFWEGVHLSSNGSIRSRVLGKRITITPSILNTILRLPQSENFVSPNFDDLRAMLQAVGYAGDIAQLGAIKKAHFSPVWSFYFDIIARCLSSKIGGYDQIPIGTLKLGYGLVMSQDVNIGELIFDDLKTKLNAKKAIHPRFITLVIMEALGETYPREGDILAPNFISKGIFKNQESRRKQVDNNALTPGMLAILNPPQSPSPSPPPPPHSSPPHHSSSSKKRASKRKKPSSVETQAPHPKRHKKKKKKKSKPIQPPDHTPTPSPPHQTPPQSPPPQSPPHIPTPEPTPSPPPASPPPPPPKKSRKKKKKKTTSPSPPPAHSSPPLAKSTKRKKKRVRSPSPQWFQAPPSSPEPTPPPQKSPSPTQPTSHVLTHSPPLTIKDFVPPPHSPVIHSPTSSPPHEEAHISTSPSSIEMDERPHSISQQVDKVVEQILSTSPIPLKPPVVQVSKQPLPPLKTPYTRRRSKFAKKSPVPHMVEPAKSTSPIHSPPVGTQDESEPLEPLNFERAIIPHVFKGPVGEVDFADPTTDDDNDDLPLSTIFKIKPTPVEDPIDLSEDSATDSAAQILSSLSKEGEQESKRQSIQGENTGLDHPPATTTVIEGPLEGSTQEPITGGSPRGDHGSPRGVPVHDTVPTVETVDTTLVDEALRERVTQEPSSSGHTIFDSQIHSSDESIPGSIPPDFASWVESADISSFSSVQELIKNEFLSFQSSISNLSSSPVTKEVHKAYLKTLKSSFLLSTGLAHQLDSLNHSFQSHKELSAKNEALHLSLIDSLSK